MNTMLRCSHCLHDQYPSFLPYRCNKCSSGAFHSVLVHGSRDSSGTVGALGPLTLASETPAHPLIDASLIPEDGLNTFQGQLVAISSPWSADSEGEFTLTVFFDSRTHRRLVESLYGDRGIDDTVGVESSRMIVTVAPPTT